jgi:outer membrane scaffolding protein for murein synthesis (MipA/OmpV family)
MSLVDLFSTRGGVKNTYTTPYLLHNLEKTAKTDMSTRFFLNIDRLSVMAIISTLWMSFGIIVDLIPHDFPFR